MACNRKSFQMRQNIEKSSQNIRELHGHVLREKEKLRENQAAAIYQEIFNQRSGGEDAGKCIEKLRRVERQNKVTMMAILEHDPKLYNLIRRLQVAERQNFELVGQFEEVETRKKYYQGEFNRITQGFVTDENLKKRAKALENMCIEKEAQVNALRNELFELKREIMSPDDFEETKKTMGVYEELLQEKLCTSETRLHLQKELEKVLREIKEVEHKPKSYISAYKLQLGISAAKEQIKKLNTTIKSTEKTYKEVMGNRKSHNSSEISNSPHRVNTCDTERNTIVKKLGKELTEGRPRQAISVLKSISKPGTPLTTRLIQLNRSQLIIKH